MNFFLPCGEIKFVRMAGDETQPTRLEACYRRMRELGSI